MPHPYIINTILVTGKCSNSILKQTSLRLQRDLCVFNVMLHNFKLRL